MNQLWAGRRKGRRGQSLVEFTLTLPVLLFLFMGIMDFGRLLLSYTQGSAAVRNALRYGVILGFTGSGATPNYLNCDAMIDRVNDVLFVNVNNVVVQYVTAADLADGTVNSPIACSPGMTAAQRAALDAQVKNGDLLRIRVEGTINLLTPFFIQSLPLVIEGQRTLVKNVDLPLIDTGGGGGGDDDDDDDDTSCDALDPLNPDSDGDGLADQWECDNLGTLNQGGGDNPDGDLCTNECEETAGGDPQVQGSPPLSTALTLLASGTNCADVKANRYMGLTWDQITSPDAANPVQGYRLYATPTAGSRTLIGTFALPGSPSDPVTCGGSAASCYNEPGADAFWTANVSKVITYDVTAYNAVGESVALSSFTYQCVFNVSNLQAGEPDGAGQIRYCNTNKQSDRYMGLTWSGNPDAEGYYIYADSAQAGQAAGVGTAYCGYTVSGANGCYNLSPGSWDANQPKAVTYVVVPYRNGGATIGPLDEAPFLSFQCKP